MGKSFESGKKPAKMFTIIYHFFLLNFTCGRIGWLCWASTQFRWRTEPWASQRDQRHPLHSRCKTEPFPKWAPWGWPIYIRRWASRPLRCIADHRRHPKWQKLLIKQELIRWTSFRLDCCTRTDSLLSLKCTQVNKQLTWIWSRLKRAHVYKLWLKRVCLSFVADARM